MVMPEDPRDLLRAAITRYAKRTGRRDCRVVIDDLAGMIGEIAAAAELDPAAIAAAAGRRIIEAAQVMTAELRRDLERAAPLGGKH